MDTSDSQLSSLTPLVRLSLVVCGIAALVGGAFGAWASMLYSHGLTTRYPGIHAGPTILSYRVLGAVVGVLAGYLTARGWCRLMYPLAARSAPHLVLTASSLGVAAGVVSTACVHLTLMAVSQRIEIPAVVFFCLFFGLPSGAATGALCGFLCRRIVPRPVA